MIVQEVYQDTKKHKPKKLLFKEKIIKNLLFHLHNRGSLFWN